MEPAMIALIAVVTIVVSIVGGFYVTRGVLALAARNARREEIVPDPPAGEESAPEADGGAGADDQAPDVGPTSPRAVAALRGGTWIGILERLAITGLILVGYPTGVALLVAIKGLGRYPELKDNPAASERFVIGTLASMIWAAGLGVLGAWWIG